MTETAWLTCTESSVMLEQLPAGASDRKLRLFAVACCRRAWHLLVDERSRRAVEVAERFADRAATDQELESARQDAWSFTLHVVHEEEAFFHLDDAALNAADIPAWAAQEIVEPLRAIIAAQRCLGATEGKAQTELLRCIIGNPFRPVAVNPVWMSWEVGTICRIAQGIYDERAFDRLPILADALEDAGCTDADLLNHCRSEGPHARGCWPVDLILGKS